MPGLGLLLGGWKLLGKIPSQVWIGLAIVGVGLVLFLWHGRISHDALREAHDRGVTETDARWQAGLDLAHQGAVVVRRQVEAQQNAVSERNRAANAAEALRIGAAADALRLSGPGAAATPRCRPLDHPAVASAASGREPTPGRTDDPGPGVPAEDRATVPWGWLVGRAEQCDLNRAEAARWRSADAEHRRLNEQMRTAGEDQPGE